MPARETYRTQTTNGLPNWEAAIFLRSELRGSLFGQLIAPVVILIFRVALDPDELHVMDLKQLVNLLPQIDILELSFQPAIQPLVIELTT